MTIRVTYQCKKYKDTDPATVLKMLEEVSTIVDGLDPHLNEPGLEKVLGMIEEGGRYIITQNGPTVHINLSKARDLVEEYKRKQQERNYPSLQRLLRQNKPDKDPVDKQYPKEESAYEAGQLPGSSEDKGFLGKLDEPKETDEAPAPRNTSEDLGIFRAGE